MTETRTKRKLAEVPSRAAQGNSRTRYDSVVWDATPALDGEPIA